MGIAAKGTLQELLDITDLNQPDKELEIYMHCSRAKEIENYWIGARLAAKTFIRLSQVSELSLTGINEMSFDRARYIFQERKTCLEAESTAIFCCCTKISRFSA